MLLFLVATSLCQDCVILRAGCLALLWRPFLRLPMLAVTDVFGHYRAIEN